MPANVIYLDRIVGPDVRPEEVFRALSEYGYQVNGPPLGIVKFIEEVSKAVEQNWLEVGRDYLETNLTATQYVYFEKPPKVYPFETDLNLIYERWERETPDSPMNRFLPIITVDLASESPASLSRRPWGPRRELTPRLRFMVGIEDKIYPVLAQRKEYIIRFSCYGSNSKEALLVKEVLEKFFHTKREILFSLGMQQGYVESVGVGTRLEQFKTKAAVRILDFYVRLEDWYIGDGLPAIGDVTIEWLSSNGLPNTVSGGSSSESGQTTEGTITFNENGTMNIELG